MLGGMVMCVAVTFNFLRVALGAPMLGLSFIHVWHLLYPHKQCMGL